MSRPARLFLFCAAGALATGGVATVVVVMGAGPGATTPSAGLLVAGIACAGFTLAALFVRFARWQFALRRLGARIPTVESLLAFTGSFAFLPVPLLIGQLAARSRLLRAPLRPPLGVVVAGFVWARLLDVWALCVLSTLALSLSSGWVLAVAAAVAGAPLVPRVRRRVFQALLGGIARIWSLFSPRPMGFETVPVDRLLLPRALAVGAGSALLAWGLAGLPLVLLADVAGMEAPGLALLGVAASGVLIGGLSLLPMGVAVSGLVMLQGLAGLAASAEAALETVFVYRVATVWLSVALGVVALPVCRRFLRSPPDPSHFDAIDHAYDSWLPAHYRDHVVGQKVSRMRPELDRQGEPHLGLDMGCGRGWYLARVRSARTRVVGMDLSRRQLAAAVEYTDGAAPLCQASMLTLPFASGCFDFAYSVNVVHHLGSPAEQRRAFEEVARVLRPGGLFFLHEMNVRNPVFRGYMGYVFPILKGIDEGIEHFLDPRRLPLPDSLELASVEYFTFVPDVCPEPLLPAMRAVERLLERSPIAPMGAHFLAVLRRGGEV